jgi:hypothetical protein
MSVELSREETDLVVELLEEEFDDIRTEIRRTENHDYKENLKVRERLVQDLLVRLKG